MDFPTRRHLILSGLAVLAAGAALFPSEGQTGRELEAALEEAAPSILASHDFERSAPSGPDTFRIFEHSTGRVDLSQSFRWSGARSLRVREEPGNGCFSEFLGFFPEQKKGRVFVQFYLLLTEPEEPMNFALAGQRWFLNMEPGGHALWLATRGSSLWHRVAERWKELFVPQPFRWYFIDLVYDVDAGRYDLAVYQEGEQDPLVDLRRQRNTADANHSPIAYYSFIGDLEDKGKGTFFVDDLLIAVDPKARLAPFVAPGRRSFFVESHGRGHQPLTQVEREDLLTEARRLLRVGELGSSPLGGDLASRLERAADEAFRARDLDLAEELYDRLMPDPGRAGRILLKLSDIYFLRGDLDSERQAREAIYGRLDLEELR